MISLNLLFSGRGSNANSLIKYILNKKLNFNINKIVCNNINATGIDLIKKLNLNVYILNINFSIFHYLKGIKYCLSEANSRQRDVSNFINICKKYHDQDECLKQEFFNYLKLNKGIFLTGPLTNMFFELIERHKNKLKLVVGKLNVTISKKSNYLYYPA